MKNVEKNQYLMIFWEICQHFNLSWPYKQSISCLVAPLYLQRDAEQSTMDWTSLRVYLRSCLCFFFRFKKFMLKEMYDQGSHTHPTHTHTLVYISKYFVGIIILNQPLSVRSIKNKKIFLFFLQFILQWISLCRSMLSIYIIFILSEELS